MPRRPAIITQADIARAIRAADQCEPPREVVIEPDGRIRIVRTENTAAIATVDEPARLRI